MKGLLLNNRRFIVGAVFILAVFLFSGCGNEWIGFYYPDENNLTVHIQSSEIKSLEECRNWVDAQISLNNPSGYGYDYECGRKCKFNKDYGLYVCKETVQ